MHGSIQYWLPALAPAHYRRPLQEACMHVPCTHDDSCGLWSYVTDLHGVVVGCGGPGRQFQVTSPFDGYGGQQVYQDAGHVNYQQQCCCGGLIQACMGAYIYIHVSPHGMVPHNKPNAELVVPAVLGAVWFDSLICYVIDLICSWPHT